MNRRIFLLASGAPAMARCNLFGASAFPYPEEQHPHAARGKRLADFARSLDIRRGMTYSSGRFSKLIIDVYSPRTHSTVLRSAILAFGLAAFKKNETSYRWDLDHLPSNPTANLYAPILAKNRVVVVANLPVSSEAMWPAQLQACHCALHWVGANAASLGIDQSRVGLVGASASGSLVSLLALLAGTGRFAELACRSQSLPTVRAVCAMSGIYDFEYYARVDAGNKSMFVDVIPPYLGKTNRLYREASPTTYVHHGAPPFLLTHGLQDQRVPYSQMTRFSQVLSQKGVTVEIDPHQ